MPNLKCSKCNKDFYNRHSVAKFCSLKCVWKNKKNKKPENFEKMRKLGSLACIGRKPWNTGKKWSEKIKKKMRLAKIGKPSPFKGKRKSTYINKPRNILPSEKDFILKKYRNQCYKCGSKKNLAIDHIYPVRKGGINNLNNLQVLCKVCNSKKWIKTDLGSVQAGQDKKLWVGNINGRYFYPAICKRVIDADTIVADIDMGFNIWRFKARLRFSRINAWELKKEERPKGLIAKQYLQERINGKEITIEIIKASNGKLTDSFGRFITEIFDVDGSNINDELVKLGHARYQDY